MKLGIVVLEITNKCNLKCIHCSVNYENLQDDLNLHEWIQILNKLKRFKPNKIVISGGEPFLYNEFFDLLKHITKNFSNVGLTSNGTLINQDICQQIKNIGLNEIQISIDGTREIHNVIRGKGNYEKSIETIKLLKNNGFRVFSMTVLSKINFHLFEKIIMELFELKIDKIGFERFTPIGRGKELNNNCLTKEDLNNIYEKYKNLKKTYPVIFNDPLFNLVPTKNNLYFPTDGCLAGINNFVIGNNGDLKVCTRLPYRIGSLLNKNLSELVRTDEVIKNLCLRNFQGKCGTCSNVYICGGCRAEAYSKNNNIFDEDSWCWHV